jgi:hypothetical protein
LKDMAIVKRIVEERMKELNASAPVLAECVS